MQRFHKIFGLILLIGGVLIILVGLGRSYQIFMATAEPPQVFSVPEEISRQERTDVTGHGLEEGLQLQIERTIQEQFEHTFPAENIAKALNLFAWTLFVGLISFGGAQLAAVGTKLTKS